MNNNDNFTTPKQTKRLGLRRNPSALKEGSSSKVLTGSITKATSATTTAANSTPRRLPQSDVRVNYRNLESKERISNGKHVPNTPSTPKTTANGLETQRQAVSTNCRPYRLSLSKKVREKMTKKRLEFHLANELEKEEAEENGDHIQMQKDDQVLHGEKRRSSLEIEQRNAPKAQLDIKEKHVNEDLECSSEFLEEIAKHELIAQIEISRKELSARQEHVKKVKELQAAINRWKTGFSSAISDLQQKIEPRLDTETLLQQLRIPQEMIKYIND